MDKVRRQIKGQETDSYLTNEDTKEILDKFKNPEMVTKHCGCTRAAAVSSGWAGRQVRTPDEIA